MEGKGEMRQGKERGETIVGVKAEDWRSRDVCPQKNTKRASITNSGVKIRGWVGVSVNAV